MRQFPRLSPAAPVQEARLTKLQPLPMPRVLVRSTHAGANPHPPPLPTRGRAPGPSCGHVCASPAYPFSVFRSQLIRRRSLMLQVFTGVSKVERRKKIAVKHLHRNSDNEANKTNRQQKSEKSS